jgi:transmembrane sensor
MKLNADIIERFIKGYYSRADYLATESLFTDIERRGDLKKYMENHWFDYADEPLPEGNFNHILDKVHHQIQLEPRPARRYSFIAVFQKVAAILIVPLLLGYLAIFFVQSKNNGAEPAMAEIQCPLGVRTKFVLPDGTKGFLNSGSTLEYPVVFGSERRVSLTGEAYFDVSPDEERPFVVNTPNLYTRVLGTQFNIIAYENENSEEIILRDGKVGVYTRQGRKLETLVPDQKMDFNTDNRRYEISQVEAGQFISWTEGMLVFRNESIEDVAKRLGRWYNVDIEIKDPELLDYSLWATFIDEPLDEVLKLLALTAPISYEELLRETTGRNLFKKRKMILRLDDKRFNDF